MGMANVQEKAGVVESQGDGYTWTQTVSEVQVKIPVGKTIRGRDVQCTITSSRLKVGLKNAAPVLDGELCMGINSEDSLWALEDSEKGDGKVIFITLQKRKAHDTWTSVIKGKNELDALTQEEMKKKMMLEKFQNEHAGFDFSGAEFSGQIPDDPASFCRPDA